MQDLAKNCFSLNIKAMKIFGLYPPDTNQNLYKIATCIMYYLLIVPVPILQCLHLYLKEDLTFKEVADNTFLIAELSCFIPKFAPFVTNGLRIKKCIHYFEALQFKVNREEHKQILENCVKVCRTTTFLFLTSVTCGFTSWSCRPIAWKGHMFPTDIWLPFDPETASKLYNCLVYIYLILAVGYGAYTSAAVDPLIAGLAYQATAQIKILKNNLQFLGEQVVQELGSPVSQKQINELLHKKIKLCIIHHHLILQFVEEYQECFSQVAFSQISSGVIVFCVSALQLTIMDFLSFNFLAMVMYLIAMLTEVYLYCHFGTILYEENETINTAIYLSKWYEFDVTSRKYLFLIMERARRPMIITIGKIFNMSLVTFAMILRRSYSLLAVLENYNIDLN